MSWFNRTQEEFKEKVAIISSTFILRDIELTPLQVAQKIDGIFTVLRKSLISHNKLEIEDGRSIVDCYSEYILATFYFCYRLLGVDESLVDEAQYFLLKDVTSCN